MNLKGYHEIKQTSVGILPTSRKLMELNIHEVNVIDMLVSWMRSEFSVMKVEGNTNMDILTHLLPCSELPTGVWSVEWKLWQLLLEISVAVAAKPTLCCKLNTVQYVLEVRITSIFRWMVLLPVTVFYTLNALSL